MKHSWLFALMLAGACSFRLTDHGSDIYNDGGISLVYTDWVAPKTSNWEKDTHECSTAAIEAVPSLVRLPGERQTLADRCMVSRGYTKR